MTLISKPKINQKSKLILHRKLDELLNDLKYIDRILSESKKKEIVFKAYYLLLEDLQSFVERDPAAKGSPKYVLNSYSCFQAVIAYRLANALYYYSGNFQNGEKVVLQQLSRLISEDAKVKTGIEIHPAARIGTQFVIDHGTGTVIGETCIIGKRSYILQGVILGSCGISHNRNGKRHPTIGDDVQIGAFAKILGSVTIGSNILISPGCVVTQDIPSNSKVLVTNEYQIIKLEKNKNYPQIKIHGITQEKYKLLRILGENLDQALISLIDDQNRLIKQIDLPIIERNKNKIICAIKFNQNYLGNLNKVKLKFDIGIKLSTIIVNSSALKQVLFLNQFESLSYDINETSTTVKLPLLS